MCENNKSGVSYFIIPLSIGVVSVTAAVTGGCGGVDDVSFSVSVIQSFVSQGIVYVRGIA